MLPTTFETTGTPVEVISNIVSEIGAIVRAQDDGSFLVRYPYPTRPCDLPTTVQNPIIEYPPSLVTNMTYQESVGEHYNIVTISCDTNDKEAPVLVLEDSEDGTELLIGETAYVRVFWFEEAPEISQASEIWTFITDGTLVEDSLNYEEFTEYVTFSDGIGSTQYPIYDITSVSWLGKPGVIDSWDQFSQAISLISTDDYKIAEITYTSQYYRYKVTNSNVIMLIASWAIRSSFNASLKIITPMIARDINRNLIDREGDDIVLNYLTEKSALVKRGENWIDQNKYNYTTVSLESPYKNEALDGKVVWLDADRIIAGNYHVSKADITMSGAKVVNNLEVVQWEV